MDEHLGKVGSWRDAHAKDGMCQVIRQARVTGELRNGRSVVSRFEMIPLETKP